ncbi:hypothetical protein QYE76_029363 [Lolium multiflorum]|uniref:Uncharacterized protein n=1 Tax=Lolium multiflorum TaxID=4521 RepID=A0AAD8VI47_LOLMU|nr:hypothetical protein QYE76_029363 [Lolium multiflorum]
MFPGRTRLPAAGAGLGMPPSTGAGADNSAPPATGAGAGRAVPPTVVLDESPEGTPQAPETTGPAGPSAAPGATPPPQPTTEEPTQQEPARDEPARTEGADSRALVRTGTSSASPQGRTWPGRTSSSGAVRLRRPALARLPLWSRRGSVPTLRGDQPGGTTGQTSVEMFFSSLQANLKARAAEAAANVAKVEEAGKAVMDRRTTLYNRAVTHYHKAKLDRIDLARELEAVKVEAAKVPQLESDLRAARAQCGESEEAGRSAARKLKLAEQELTRLRQLEQNHLIELNSLRTAEKEKVDDLSRRLTEVEKQRLALQEEVTAKSTELTATAKRWTEGFGALDRGLAASSASRRGDQAPADLKAARLARASTIADFVDKTVFVADPNPPPSDEDYMDDEEAEDVPEDDPAGSS